MLLKASVDDLPGIREIGLYDRNEEFRLNLKLEK
jgi:hypothetical protein